MSIDFLCVIGGCLKSFSCMLTVTSPPLKGAGGMLIIRVIKI